MGRVVASGAVSLDGYLAGPGEEMDWVFAHDEPNPLVEKLIAGTGAFLSGRRSFDWGERNRQEAFDGTWSGPQFVLTHRPPPDHPGVTFLAGDIVDAVATALAAAGAKDLNVAGGDVVTQCLAAGLVDELVLMVMPVLLGGGLPMFGALDDRAPLELVEQARTGQVTALRYRVLR